MVVASSFKEPPRYLHNAHGPQWSQNPDAHHEKEVGADCLWRAAGADWWEWRQGSTLMFWHWPEYARKLALEGHKPWFKYMDSAALKLFCHRPVIAEHYPLSAQDEVVEVYQTSDELLIE